MSEPDAVQSPVNMTELAAVLDTSETTIRKMIAAHDDFPIVERGDKGVSYVFDAVAVKAWLDGHREAEEEARRLRSDELQQLRMELFGDDLASDDGAGLTPGERQKEIAAEIAATKLAEARGELTRAVDVERAVSAAMMTLRSRLEGLPLALQRRLGLKRDETVIARELVREALNDCADALTGVSAPEDDRAAAA